MTYNANTPCEGPTPSLQVCDATSSSVRLAWQRPRRADPLSEEQQVLLALQHEEAVHELVRRRFLLTTERYLKSDLGTLLG
ncbi:hypothetical protein [Halomonas salipaludis]|uniref:Uncharacterized protein n=1 Tax=Halomonas salipaludis TaxID=2032625 RepID=A0A2A2EVK5_9GAMM|nr:hypothetical protein [Halomonas salipaludis]PAU77156.1 hypothetical protein CK498_07840 [Halomonas salipaludis]